MIEKRKKKDIAKNRFRSQQIIIGGQAFPWKKVALLQIPLYFFIYNAK